MFKYHETWIDKLQENKVFKAVLAVVFALALATPSAFFTTVKAWADEAQDTTAITFVLDGEADITIEGDNINESLNADNAQVTLDVKTGTAVHVAGSLAEPNDMSITTRDMSDTFDVNTPEGFENTSNFEKNVTAGGIDKIVSISIGELPSQESLDAAKLPADAEEASENAANGISTMSVQPRSSSSPYVGEVFDGYGLITWVSGGSGHVVNYVDFEATSGVLTELGEVRVYCSDHGRAAPVIGGRWYYTATVTDINYDTGEVALDLWLTGTGEYIYEDGYQRLEGSNSIWREFGGWMDLQKVSANEDITNGNDCYSLDGAEYGVYKSETDANTDTNRVSTLTTNADGYAKSDRIDAATYYVKEAKAPKGYALDETVYTVTVRNGQTVSVNGGKVADLPQNDPANILVGKFDGETSFQWEENLPQGAASLSGAEFTVTYYDTQASSAEELGYNDAENAGDYTRQWVFATDNDGFISLALDEPISGDPLYVDSNNVVTFPLGTYVIQETKAPTGYNLNSEVFIRNVTSQGTFETVETYNTPEVPDTVKRGDLEFSKTAENDQVRLAHVPFRITSTTTGESHIVFTDENGFFSTSSSYNAHTNDTNGNDDAYNPDGTVAGEDETESENPYFVEENYNGEAGTWFGMNADGETTEPNDDMGALPYDTYTIEELPCEANEGLQLMDKQTFTISRDNFTVDLGTIDNPKVYIHTTATDKVDGDKYIVADDGSVVLDTVVYEGAVEDREYTLETKLVDKSNNNAEIAKQTTNFTASKADGSVTIEIPFDSSELVEHELTIVETISSDGRVLATHNENLDESEQTVKVIQSDFDTIGRDGLDGDKSIVIDTHSKVTDTINTTQFLPGETYTAEGKLMRLITAEDGTVTAEPFTVGGKEVTNSVEFKASAASESVDVSFEFDATEYAGQTIDLVIFETIYKDGKVVSEEIDPNNVNQQVTLIPSSIATSATDGIDGDSIVAADPEAVVTDTVSYRGLLTGSEYTLHGELMKKVYGEDGTVSVEAVKNAQGEAVTSDVAFTPENDTYGTVDVSFAFDATTFADGDELVVFETLYREGKQIAEHKDANDVNQTVSITRPVIGTTATDTVDGDHSVVADSQASVTDTVEYENLVPGKEYTLTGTLMIKKAVEGNEAVEQVNEFSEFLNTLVSGITGEESNITLSDDALEYESEPLLDKDGNPVTATVTFTPKASYGSVDLTFEFDARDLIGQEVVAFESLSRDGIEVAVHADINDEGQTVEIVSPKIGTTAVDGIDGDKTVIADTEAVVIDTVSYENVMVNHEYSAHGELMKKVYGEDGTVSVEPVLDKEGNPVVADTDFTPVDSYGTVDLSFTFDATGFVDGDELVVFESLYRDGVELTNHKDANDEGQTVVIKHPVIGTTATDGFDGDKTVVADTQASVKDVVEYSDVIVGKEYQVTGTLQVKNVAEDGTVTGEPLLDKDGNPVTVSTTFTPKDTYGSVELTFSFDSSLLGGKELVAFESLSRDGIEVAVHADINDEGQTVQVANPEIATSATDKVDGDKNVVADGNATIVDNVTYKNLLPGANYTLGGIVIDKATGLPLMVGSDADQFSNEQVKAFAEKLAVAYGLGEFEVDENGNQVYKSYGFVENAFPVDENAPITDNASDEGSEGDTGVQGGTDVSGEGSEGEIGDEAVEETHTLPLNPDFETLTNLYAENADLYEHFVVSSTEFSPEYAEGSVNVEYNFDASNFIEAEEATDTVVYEVLLKDNLIVAIHADRADAGQTTTIVPSEIGTTLADKTDGDHYFLPSSETTLVDTVEYENLIPGQEYEVVGKLMQKNEQSGEPEAVLDSRGQEVVATTTFTPNQPSGTIALEFTFDSTQLPDGQAVVAFETLYKDGVEVAVHADIDDEAQTAWVGEPPLGEQFAKTGETLLPWIIGIALLLLAGSSAATYYVRKRKLADGDASKTVSVSSSDSEE